MSLYCSTRLSRFFKDWRMEDCSRRKSWFCLLRPILSPTSMTSFMLFVNAFLNHKLSMNKTTFIAKWTTSCFNPVKTETSLTNLLFYETFHAISTFTDRFLASGCFSVFSAPSLILSVNRSIERSSQLILLYPVFRDLLFIPWKGRKKWIHL